MDTKKGADRCVYLYGALDMPQCDKRKRPTPQTGCCPWSYDQRPVEKPVTTNRDTPQNGIPA